MHDSYLIKDICLQIFSHQIHTTMDFDTPELSLKDGMINQIYIFYTITCNYLI